MEGNVAQIRVAGHSVQRENQERNVPVSVSDFRDLMAGVCSPVTVITRPLSAFASLSLDPPMRAVFDKEGTMKLSGMAG